MGFDHWAGRTSSLGSPFSFSELLSYLRVASLSLPEHPCGLQYLLEGMAVNYRILRIVLTRIKINSFAVNVLRLIAPLHVLVKISNVLIVDVPISQALLSEAT